MKTPGEWAIGEESPSTLPGFLLFLPIALILCSAEVVFVTGTNLPLAPFFYLLAGRRWGFTPGLIAAAVLSAPIWWGTGAWWYVPLSVASYLFACWLRRRGLLAAEAIALFELLISPLIAALYLWHYQAPGSVLLLLVLQFALGEVMLATIADVVGLNFTIVRRPPFLVARPSRSIDGILRTMINFIVVFVVTLSIANQAVTSSNFQENDRSRIRAMAIAHASGRVRAGEPEGQGELRITEPEQHRIFFSTTSEGFEKRAHAALAPACRFPKGVDPARTPHADRTTWTGTCEIIRDGTPDHPVLIAIAYDDDTTLRRPWATYRLLLLLLGAAIALLYRVSLSRSLRRTMDICEDFLARFGTPDLPVPARLPIKEVDGPLRQFVERNNSYAAAVADRDRLMKVAVDLKRSVDLTLMGHIRFDAASGILSFSEIRMTLPPILREVQVHAADCGLFMAGSERNEAVVEFRAAGNEDFNSRIVTLRQSNGPMRWDNGIMVKLSQPQRLRELMVQQARLVDLGGVASAISHEIKQPLFTIAVAAESMQLMLEKGRTEALDRQMASRVARISEQVERAREIIDRISQYGRTDVSTTSEVDPTEVVRIAHSFLAAMLDDRRIALTIKVAPSTRREADTVLMSRIALEQVVVNAIQNAADSIQTRRETGWTGAGQITIEVAAIGRKVRCTIGDNGVGLPPGMAESAFNAFFTTKPNGEGTGLGLFISRQIIIEAGGNIRLHAGAPDGAVLEIDLPLYEAAV